jgi:hypothetical protein
MLASKYGVASGSLTCSGLAVTTALGVEPLNPADVCLDAATLGELQSPMERPLRCICLSCPPAGLTQERGHPDLTNHDLSPLVYGKRRREQLGSFAGTIGAAQRPPEGRLCPSFVRRSRRLRDGDLRMLNCLFRIALERVNVRRAPICKRHQAVVVVLFGNTQAGFAVAMLTLLPLPSCPGAAFGFAA